jgi:hypothetical protein
MMREVLIEQVVDLVIVNLKVRALNDEDSLLYPFPFPDCFEQLVKC